MTLSNEEILMDNLKSKALEQLFKKSQLFNQIPINFIDDIISPEKIYILICKTGISIFDPSETNLKQLMQVYLDYYSSKIPESINWEDISQQQRQTLAILVLKRTLDTQFNQSIIKTILTMETQYKTLIKDMLNKVQIQQPSQLQSSHSKLSRKVLLEKVSMLEQQNQQIQDLITTLRQKIQNVQDELHRERLQNKELMRQLQLNRNQLKQMVQKIDNLTEKLQISQKNYQNLQSENQSLLLQIKSKSQLRQQQEQIPSMKSVIRSSKMVTFKEIKEQKQLGERTKLLMLEHALQLKQLRRYKLQNQKLLQKRKIRLSQRKVNR